MTHAFDVNEPPYCTERVYTALRLAPALLYLMADAMFAAYRRLNQKGGYSRYASACRNGRKPPPVQL
jgi:hypothetical protein